MNSITEILAQEKAVSYRQNEVQEKSKTESFILFLIYSSVHRSEK